MPDAETPTHAGEASEIAEVLYSQAVQRLNEVTQNREPTCAELAALSQAAGTIALIDRFELLVATLTAHAEALTSAFESIELLPEDDGEEWMGS